MAEAVNVPLYTMEILRLATAVPDYAPLDREDGRAELRSPTCGSRIMIQVRLSGERVEAIALKVEACAFGQASAALLARSAAGKNKAEVSEAIEALTGWLDGSRDDPGSWPDLAALAPARSRKSRHGAILLPFRALLAAMEGQGDERG